jgi:hypothetical protein
MNRISNNVDSGLTMTATVENDLGTKATTAARNLCAYRITGDMNWITTWAMNANHALRRLERVQRQAGNDHPTTCVVRTWSSPQNNKTARLGVK